MFNVLIVDDEEAIRHILSSVITSIEDKEIAVATAESGEEAVLMCQSQSFDLVLMDYTMKGIDGIESTKQMTIIQSTKVVFMTGYALDKSVREKIGKVSTHEILAKPFSIKDISRVVNTFLDS